MLKKKKYQISCAPSKKVTTQVLKPDVVDGKKVVVLTTVDVADINKDVYNPSVINATAVVQSGQPIQGKVDLNPTDVETITEGQEQIAQEFLDAHQQQQQEPAN